MNCRVNQLLHLIINKFRTALSIFDLKIINLFHEKVDELSTNCETLVECLLRILKNIKFKDLLIFHIITYQIKIKSLNFYIFDEKIKKIFQSGI